MCKRRGFDNGASHETVPRDYESIVRDHQPNHQPNKLLLEDTREYYRMRIVNFRSLHLRRVVCKRRKP